MKVGLTSAQWKRLRSLIKMADLDPHGGEVTDKISRAIVSGDLDLGTRHRAPGSGGDAA
jgi:hypothetical protein